MNGAYIAGYAVSMILLGISCFAHNEKWSGLVAKIGATLFAMTYFYAEVVAK